MKFLITLLICILAILTPVHPVAGDEAIQWNDEIVYHVMPRSFRDSNGDGHGDLRGLIEGLDYPEILECHAVSGEADYLLRVVAADLKAFSDFLMHRLLRLLSVSQDDLNRTCADVGLHLLGHASEPA